MRAALVYLAFALFFAFSAAAQLERYPAPPPAVASIYGCLLLLVAMWLLPAFPDLRAAAKRRLTGVRGAVAGFLLFPAPYLLYALGTGDFSWTALARIAALPAGPLAIFTLAPIRDPKKLAWQDALALAWLAAPVLARWLGGLWNVPVNLDFMARLYVCVVGAWSFLIFRGVDGAGYEARLSVPILRAAFLNFGLFTVIGLPLGLAMGFIAWNPSWRGPWELCFNFVTLFVFIAIPEELFFRGLLQNLLEGSWQSRRGAQAVAAVLFGLTHILHGFPNWPYVLMASVAGWFYGSAWRSTRSLVASGVTHALVDAVWRTWFEAG